MLPRSLLLLKAAVMDFPPPAVAAHRLVGELRDAGYAVLDAAGFAAWTGVGLDAANAWQASWDELPRDPYLRDGGRYRSRRHACFVVEGDRVEPVAHRAHWQPVEYNALHGGIERWFEPMAPALVGDAAWRRLLARLGAAADAVRGAERWHVEAHQFRIDTSDRIGRPTPEGAHRDGVDFVAVLLVARGGVKGGETRVFEAAGRHGVRFTMTEPWSMLMLDDARVIHETTPIQPLDPAVVGRRDTLVVTLRKGGFQEA